MSKIISIGNMKGGVGKTTTAIHLAQQLGKKGKTLLLDADEELQCAMYWRAGDYPGWAFEALPYKDARNEYTSQFDYIIVDTKGNEQAGDLVHLARNSSLLIVPTKPDGVSATGLLHTLKPLREAEIQNYAVLIVANVGGRGEELRDALAEQSVPVMTTIVRHSTSVGDISDRRQPLEAFNSNRYAKLVNLDYGSVTREVLSHVQ